jgi:hypothetical protein
VTPGEAQELLDTVRHVRDIALSLARLCGWLTLVTGLFAWNVGGGTWPGVLICGLLGGATLMALLFAYGAHHLLNLDEQP